MNSRSLNQQLLTLWRGHYPAVCLTAGLALMTGAALGAQPASATKLVTPTIIINPPVKESPAPRSIGSPEGFAPVVEKVAPAVVRIVASVAPSNLGDLADLAGGTPSSPLRSYVGQVSGGNVRRALSAGLGSGVIVTGDGYILTNGHLVGGAREVEVALKDGREFKAKVIGLDRQSDIALIKIDAHQLPTVPLAQSQDVRVGDVVLAVGHPFGVGQTVTHGIVSATDRGGMGIEDYENFIQTDAPINPGNSGGALVDTQGHLIGVNTAILSRSGGNLGIGFAVPSDLVRRVMTDLMNYGCVFRGYLGVEAQDLTPELAREFKLPGTTGVLVGGVVPNGPAELAGLQIGDVITQFNGKAVRGTRELRLSVADGRPCQSVSIEVLRNGSPKVIPAILDRAPDENSSAQLEPCSIQQVPGALQDVTVIELTSPVRQLLNIPRRVQGAVVLDLRAYSPAAQAGLRPGEVIESVNRQPVRSAEETLRLTADTSHKSTLLRVWNQEGSHFIVVNPGRVAASVIPNS